MRTFMSISRLACALCLLATAAHAHAQNIYRCGPGAGITYSQTPCAGGRRVEVGDPRSESQRAEAREVATRTSSLGDTMAQDRRIAEAAIRPASAASLSAAAQPLQQAEVPKPKRAPKSRSKRTTTTPPAAQAMQIGLPIAHQRKPTQR